MAILMRLMLLLSPAVVLTAKIVHGFGSLESICPTARPSSLVLRDTPISSKNEVVVRQAKIPVKIFGIARRDSVGKAFHALFFGLTVLTSQPKPGEAACLAGDTSKECIGYYKVPIDDATEKYFDTPENLSKFAPDLKWVPPIQYPKTYKIAREELLGLQTRVQNLRSPVLKGDLEDAGTEILGIVPRITVAGRVVIQSLNSYLDYPSPIIVKKTGKTGRELAMRAYRSEDAHSELLANLGEIDIMIGQFLHGEPGALTVTQIEILSILKEADRSFIELMKAIPTFSKYKV